MRRAVASFVERVTEVRGNPPSADLAIRVTEATGTEHVMISHGDSIQYVSGTDQAGYTVTVLSPRAALKLSWWILWNWWVRGLLLGSKLSAWQWAVEAGKEERELDARIARMKVRRRGHQA